MYNKFSEGDIVEAIDDDIHGEVVKIAGDLITVNTSDEILLTYSFKDLILKQRLPVNKVRLTEKHLNLEKRVVIKSKKQNNSNLAVVDLHIHQLIDNEQGLDAYDKLSLQLNTVKEKIQWARDNNVSKLVFIHGIGKGVLRKELEKLLKGYQNLTFYDANYQDYGRGALEVYLYQNSKNLE